LNLLDEIHKVKANSIKEEVDKTENNIENQVKQETNNDEFKLDNEVNVSGDSSNSEYDEELETMLYASISVGTIIIIGILYKIYS
jgi:hypothetical protein